jgi:hypothetical protein
MNNNQTVVIVFKKFISVLTHSLNRKQLSKGLKLLNKKKSQYLISPFLLMDRMLTKDLI